MGSKIRSTNGFEEAFRYYRNARGLLARCEVKDDIYSDIKPVQEAFGTAWLAIDKAIKAALLEKGLPPNKIPRSWDGIRENVARRLAYQNGRLMKLLNTAYDMVHLGGYYWGDFKTPAAAKAAFDVARRAIETLSGRKIG
ncbi:MAG: DUF5618 family protein [Nitrospirae bacterium]|nr:DUF5618 family protein [Nitrospirota bacterium]